MSVPVQAPTVRDSHQHNTPTIDNAPPTRSKVTGGLAALAYARMLRPAAAHRGRTRPF